MRRLIGIAGITGVLATALVLASVGPALATHVATTYHFTGSNGTNCTVDVGADATDGIDALQLPRVGFSGEPRCTYARPPSTTGTGSGAPASSLAAGATKGKKCAGKRKPKRKKNRRCKKKRKSPRSATEATTRVSNPAHLSAARLQLFGPLGLPSLFGDKTLLSLPTGYSCALDEGAGCSDAGNLTPAIPLLSYFSQYSFQLTPPAGETWTSQPPGCTASCVLTSPQVTPRLL